MGVFEDRLPRAVDVAGQQRLVVALPERLVQFGCGGQEAVSARLFDVRHKEVPADGVEKRALIPRGPIDTRWLLRGHQADRERAASFKPTPEPRTRT